MPITTTLNKIRSFSPCEAGWKTLLKSLNKTEPDDEPLTYLYIVESNGLEHALWCMRCEWFENKGIWMQFVYSCVKSANAANAYANTYAASANTYARTAAAATVAAASAANAAAAYAVAVAAARQKERARQKDTFIELVS